MEVGGTSVTFQWQHFGSWGTGCPTTKKNFKLYVKKGTGNYNQIALLTSDQKSYAWNGVTQGVTHRWYVQATNGSRSTDSSINSFTAGSPTCTVSLTPATSSISEGSIQAFTASVVPSNGTVDNVAFSSSDTAVATVSPATLGEDFILPGTYLGGFLA